MYTSSSWFHGLHSCCKKLFCLIFIRLAFLICFFRSFIGSSASFLACASGSSTSHSQAGYSLSSNATGSLPDFFTFTDKTVPAGHDDFTTVEGVSCRKALQLEKRRLGTKRNMLYDDQSSRSSLFFNLKLHPSNSPSIK